QDNGIGYFGETLGEQGKAGLIRLRDREQQLRAQSLIQRALGDGYVVALNLAQNTPDWMKSLGGAPMKLGLDLSGGAHFLLEVDTPSAVAKRLEFSATGIKRKLRDERVRGFIEHSGDTIVGKFKDEELANKAIEAAAKEYSDFQHKIEPSADGRSEERRVGKG